VVTLDEVQAAYDEALRRIVRDLPAGTVDATITVDFTVPDGDVPYRFEGHGCSLPFTADPEEATVILADQVQEDVFETVWSACWPQCRWHDHPPVPRLKDGKAAWVCPRTGDQVARIGEMSGVKPSRHGR
jgi:hypothetical protein